MKRLLKHNPNTAEYWNDKYTEEPDYPPEADDFKFTNIAHHIHTGDRVIDLGCGNGQLCKVIHRERPRCFVTGLDYSEKQVKKLRDEKIPINFIQGDATDTRLEAESYDFVVSCETIEHLDDPVGLIEEASRLLKPGGRFLITTPYKDHIPSDEHVWQFTYRDIKKMLVRNFKKSWVSPWAAGWTDVKTGTGEIYYPQGHWDTIFGLAIK